MPSSVVMARYVKVCDFVCCILHIARMRGSVGDFGDQIYNMPFIVHSVWN